MNILFSCAGRRNYLIRFFKEALRGRGKTVATDMSDKAPAMVEADIAEVVPEVYADDYIDRLLEICKRHDVRAVLPLNDLDLPILAGAKNRFIDHGIVPIVSDPKTVDICFDKWKTSEFLRSNGIPTPKTFLTPVDARKALENGELRFPVVVKPRWGSGSIGIEFVFDREELNLAYALAVKKVQRSILGRASKADSERMILIQEKIDGPEYGLDIVNDLDGCYQATITKRKIAMRAGETDKAVTVENEALQKIGEKIGKTTGHIGNLDCDVFESGGVFYVLEMNPRFGGGYPFSHMAGANVPRAIIAWLNGEVADPTWIRFDADSAHAKCDMLVGIDRTD